MTLEKDARRIDIQRSTERHEINRRQWTIEIERMKRSDRLSLTALIVPRRYVGRTAWRPGAHK